MLRPSIYDFDSCKRANQHPSTKSGEEIDLSLCSRPVICDTSASASASAYRVDRHRNAKWWRLGAQFCALMVMSMLLLSALLPWLLGFQITIESGLSIIGRYLSSSLHRKSFPALLIRHTFSHICHICHICHFPVFRVHVSKSVHFVIGHRRHRCLMVVISFQSDHRLHRSW